jgi:dTDP-4-amino-4,6-dideoxygalactose transaminase
MKGTDMIMKEKLALHGGKAVRSKPFPSYNFIGKEELKAARDVISTGVLSKFLGCHDPDFMGGPKVQEFETKWAVHMGAKFAISVNSCTSGLYAACGAVGIGPGDEVIVSPYTMSASASCVLAYNAIPVFADVDEDTFCISPETIAKVISSRTKAIVVVHIMGRPADMDGIMQLAKEHNLKIIEDCAQSPGAIYKNKKVGTIGDIGVFSLNYHKTIHTGEGGVAITDNEELATRLRLIRNHAEAVCGDMGVTNLVNLLGFNYRMTEIEAAIGIEQLKKLDKLTEPRIKLANYLTEKLSNIKGITPPEVKSYEKHVYYIYPIKYDENVTGISRDVFVNALNAEGIPFFQGYSKPLYLQPIYQKKIVYGEKGCPFTCQFYDKKINYEKGICPVVERLYEKELMYTNLCRPPLTFKDMDDIVKAIKKVISQKESLAV